MAKKTSKRGARKRGEAKPRRNAAEPLSYVRKVPVAGTVDVLVVGAGIAGCTAALTAARNGAQVMVVDRFGKLGGNMGPGMFSGGVVHLNLLFPETLPEGLKGIPGEFLSRCGAYVDGQLGHHYHKDAEVVAYVWLKLMEESNVQVLLNTAAGDPIMDGKRITGMVLENRLGTQAVRAQVVIDATGDAEVAFRAGAPMDPCIGYWHPGMYFAIGDVDEASYQEFAKNAPEADPADVKWAQDMHKACKVKMGFRESFKPLLPYFKRAFQVREYCFVQRIGDLASITVDHGLYFRPQHPGLVGAQVGLSPLRDVSDTEHLNELEIGTRKYIFETAQFLRHHIPGFKHSYLHTTSPYFHSRAGRSAVCEYCITRADIAKGRTHDDVVFRTWAHEVSKKDCTPGGFDFPYRQLLPKGVEGLLMAGRSAIVQPPTNRTRYKVMLMGQAAGAAAALAARSAAAPRQVDIRELQRLLHQKYHVYMGSDRKRLQRLGLL